MENKTNSIQEDYLRIYLNVVEDDNGFTASITETSKTMYGLNGAVAWGKTKIEAYNALAENLKAVHGFKDKLLLKYKRFAFEIGKWDGIGTHWILIFGIHIYFRYGSDKKHGFYVPFTKLNILITNYWKTYKTYLKDNGK